MVCAVVGAAHTTTILIARGMKMPAWLKKTKNDAKASSSLFARCRHMPPFRPPAALLHKLPPTLVGGLPDMPTRIVAPSRRHQNHHYVPIKEWEQRWRDNKSIDHLDVSLPAAGT
jgi:hypothetical protein